MAFQVLSGQFNLMQNINELKELIKLISKLPGLGKRSAQRLILKLINNRDEIMKPMVNNLAQVYKKVLEIFPDAELIDINVKQDEN